MELTINENHEVRSRTSKPLLIIAIMSMVMLFGGLTSAYIVRHGQGNWLKFELPYEFYISTGLIILSSVTMVMAQSSIKKGDGEKLKLYLAMTLLLGLGFVVAQFMGWSSLVKQNVFFAGNQSNASGSFLYALTGLHLAHLFGGIIMMIYTVVKAVNNRYSKDNFLGVQLSSIYWHFLDVLWVLLFLFLVFIR